MRTPVVRRIPPGLGLGFLLVACVAVALPLVSADEFVVGTHPATLLLPPGELVDDSPGVKPAGAVVACNRVHFRGVSRLWNLRKYTHALKLRAALVVPGDAGSRVPSFEVCFHRNATIGVGMCREGRWEKVPNGRWARSVSPFDYGILDFRISQGQSLRFKIEVSTEEEMLQHRAFFLAAGLAMMASAHWLSESVSLYYGSSMGVGIVLVVLILLFQATKLLPFGRRSSLVMLMYSSAVGAAGFLLHYLSDLLRSFLVEFGISEDMQNPLGMFTIICLVLAGALLGFWTVRKFVLSEDGSSVDTGIASFVKWAMRIFSAAMILESSLDLLLALEALAASILLTVIAVRRATNFLFLIQLCSRLIKFIQRSKVGPKFSSNISHLGNNESPAQKNMMEEIKDPHNMIEEAKSPSKDIFEEAKSPGNHNIEEAKSPGNHNIEEAKSPSENKIEEAKSPSENKIEAAQPLNALETEPLSVAAGSLVEPPVISPVQNSVEEEIFLSTFHNTPNRKKISKEEWEAITAETTEKAMKELCSSPDFSRWVIANAERIAVTPKH